MLGRTAGIALALTIVGSCWAATYRVRNNKNSGNNSLRWAIKQANARAGRDRILFAPSLSGKVIAPQTRLPTISDNQTIINGDIDGDGKPDVVISGRRLASGWGLYIIGNRCTVSGLAIVGCPGIGISLFTSHYTTIRSCHVGVNLAGAKPVYNTVGDILVSRSDHVLIGGTTGPARNIISGGTAPAGYGVSLNGSNDCVISGNYIGLNRAGTKALGAGRLGVSVAGSPDPATNNTIGGAASGAGNVLGGLEYGVRLSGASGNVVAGNLIGLAADGSTLASIATACVDVRSGAHHNTIGGTTAGARNVLAGGADYGVYCRDTGTRGNKVRGNYFGLNKAGTARRRLTIPIIIRDDAGSQIIGGGTKKAGNYIDLTPGSGAVSAIYVYGSSASGTIIRNNKLGVRPNGREAPLDAFGITLRGASAQIRGNTIMSGTGIAVREPSANALIVGNTFRRCWDSVRIMDGARPSLGNLTNSNTTDDGGNIFDPNSTWHIRNLTGNRIRAEGNDFKTTSKAAIDGKIEDKLDNPSYGRVDFDPLIGGVHPTAITAAALSITGAAAVPTSAGAQITFTLSSGAHVTARVLNIAGRPVKTLCRARPCEPGTNTLLWNARSDSGLPVPRGAYLVELSARSSHGAESRALTRLTIDR